MFSVSEFAGASLGGRAGERSASGDRPSHVKSVLSSAAAALRQTKTLQQPAASSQHLQNSGAAAQLKCDRVSARRVLFIPPGSAGAPSSPVTMADPAPSRSVDSFSLHSTGQDSAIQVSEAAEQPVPVPADSQDHAAPQEPDNQPDYVSDSGFDSGSLLGDETDTLASSIMHYRMENGRQYHAYRDGAYWVGGTASMGALRRLTAAGPQ